MKKIIMLLIIATIFLGITACSPKNPYVNMSFQDTCKATGGMWMKMQPTKDFIPTGAPACEGCMQRNGDHICDKDAYLQSLR